jgi:hypothetical protein
MKKPRAFELATAGVAVLAALEDIGLTTEEKLVLFGGLYMTTRRSYVAAHGEEAAEKLEAVFADASKKTIEILG